jgi:hypothetical protein
MAGQKKKFILPTPCSLQEYAILSEIPIAGDACALAATIAADGTCLSTGNISLQRKEV